LMGGTASRGMGWPLLAVPNVTPTCQRPVYKSVTVLLYDGPDLSVDVWF